MAWKKVLVSGSVAELSRLEVDNAITASAFKGDGSGLTGINATTLDIDNFGSDLTSATLVGGDLLIGSDNGTEGRVSISQLATPLQGNGLVENSGVLDVNVDDSSIEISSDALQVKDGGIVSASLAANAVGTANIFAGAVTTAKIANGAIGTDKIGDEQVTNDKLADDAVGTDELADAAVVSASLAANAVGEVNIFNGAVARAKIAADAIDGTKIADDAVDSEHINGGAIDSEHFSAGAVNSASLASNAVGEANIFAGAVSTAKIAADAIDGTKIADNAVDSEHIAADSIDEEHIAAGAIDETGLNTSVAGTGLSGGGGTALSVDYGSTAGTAVQGNTTLTVSGTSGEITIDAGSGANALGTNTAITLGLADTISGARTFSGDVTVSGDLTVTGDTFQAQVTNLNVDDQFILLNSGSTTGDSGIIFGGSNGTANSGHALMLDQSYNSNDGRLAIKVTDTSADSTDDFAAGTSGYYVAGVFEGTEANAATALADHAGNIRIESGEIYIYA